MPPFPGTSGGYCHVSGVTLGGNITRGRGHVAARVAAIVPLLGSLSLSGFLSC